MSTVDALAASLRARILDGELQPGDRLVEQALTDRHDVARHTVRAALRRLEAEGLVQIARNRGAHVARLDADAVRDLFALRTALEVEAARLALERHDGTLPADVHAALGRLVAECRRARAGWSDITEAHTVLHHAIVAASAAPRLVAAHAALQGELRLAIAGLHPDWSRERMAEHHLALVTDLERDGADVLRAHLADGAGTLLGAPQAAAEASEASSRSTSAAG